MGGERQRWESKVRPLEKSGGERWGAEQESLRKRNSNSFLSSFKYYAAKIELLKAGKEYEQAEECKVSRRFSFIQKWHQHSSGPEFRLCRAGVKGGSQFIQHPTATELLTPSSILLIKLKIIHYQSIMPPCHGLYEHLIWNSKEMHTPLNQISKDRIQHRVSGPGDGRKVYIPYCSMQVIKHLRKRTA